MSAHPAPERLSAFLDRELAAAEAARIESHLGGCAECSAHVAELAAVDAQARAVRVQAPEGYFDAFPARVRARMQAPRARALPPRAWAFLAAAAAVLLAVPLALRVRELPAPATAPPPATTPSDRPEKLSAPPRDRMAPALAASVAPEVADGRVGGEEARTQRREAAPGADARLQSPAQKRSAREGLLEEQERDLAGPAMPAAPPAPARLPSPAVAQDAASPEKAAAPRAEAPPAAAPETKEREEGHTPAPTGAGRRPRPLEGGARARAGSAAANETAVAEGFADELPADRADAAPARFGILARRRLQTAAEAREVRDAWRAFALDHEDGALADEARVREIEAGETAWRLGGDRGDLQRARADAEAYLRREDARGRERVRAVRERLRREE